MLAKNYYLYYSMLVVSIDRLVVLVLDIYSVSSKKLQVCTNVVRLQLDLRVCAKVVRLQVGVGFPEVGEVLDDDIILEEVVVVRD